MSISALVNKNPLNSDDSLGTVKIYSFNPTKKVERTFKIINPDGSSDDVSHKTWFSAISELACINEVYEAIRDFEENNDERISENRMYDVIETLAMDLGFRIIEVV